MEMHDSLVSDFVYDKQGGKAVYVALAEHIEAKIIQGLINQGSRLPAQREVARLLGLNLTTVARSFRLLYDKQLIAGRAGSGSVVLPLSRRPVPSEEYSSAPLDSGVLDLTVNRPASNAFLEELDNVLLHLAKDQRFHTLQDYHQPEGAYWLRQAIADWLLVTGTVTSAVPDQLIVTYGAQHALACVLRTLCSAEDTVLSDETTYQGVVSLCNSLRLSLQGVAMDEEGMIPSALDAACRLYKPKAVILIPTLHNPTAKTLTPERRRALADIARQHQIAVIEDDVYRSLHDNPGPSLASLYPELSYYIGGFSKSVAPGLRIGFVLVPPGCAPRVSASMRIDAWCVSPLNMLIAAHLLESGALSGIVAKQKAELSARQALLARELHAFAVNSHPTSTHAWLKLPPPWTAKSFVSTARIRGVALLGSEMFSLRDEGRQEAVRLNVGAPRSREDLGRALRILRDILMSADGNLGGRF